MIKNIKINYRKKDYIVDNKKVNYFALCSGEKVLLLRKTINTISNEIISSHYHNFECKKEYNDKLKEISSKDSYMISKNEFNRLFKIFKEDFVTGY